MRGFAIRCERRHTCDSLDRRGGCPHLSLYVVERNRGPGEGSTVYAICSSREEAHMARVRLFTYLRSRNKLIGRKLRKELFIRQVLPNTVYPLGVEKNNYVLIEGEVV